MPDRMARTNRLMCFSFITVVLSAVITAHPFRHAHHERSLHHRQSSHSPHRRSVLDTEPIDVGIADLVSRYDSTAALRDAALNMLASKNESELAARQSMSKSQLQDGIEALEAALQSLVGMLSSSLGLDLNSTDSSMSSDAPTSGANSTLPTSPTWISALGTRTGDSDAYTTYTTVTSTTLAQPSSPTQISQVEASQPSSAQASTIQGSQAQTIQALSPTQMSILAASYRSTGGFNPMAQDNVAVYYGQTDQTSAIPLTEICADNNIDIIILAFLPTLFGPGGWPTLNMGPNCWAATSAQTQAGASGLIDCVSPGFASQVSSCQSAGKKVLLSLGGAQGYSNTYIPSQTAADQLASTLWNLFLGGTEDSAIRPFGSVILDGIDIDNESGSYGYFSDLIAALRNTFAFATFNGDKPYYISAAPQCPRPDASIPLSSMQTQIDFVWVQFYNNPSCNPVYSDDPYTSFLSSLDAWLGDLSADDGQFMNIGNGVTSPRVFVGVLAFAGGGSGFLNASEFQELLYSTDGRGPNFGGIMFWDGAYGEETQETDGVGVSYMGLVKENFG